MAIDGTYPVAVPAPALGDDTAVVLGEWLALDGDRVAALRADGTVS
jgi:2-methylfumaryl-CoA isomerase